ncbi:hypothetical protein G9A89_017309 [Geosiphon pyriformis]|nr:hypothetical protein G9A89_017309 [Geosiphon pyriformis]
MSKKKAPKSAFHGSAGGSFSQKKKVVLRNIKHFGNKKDISLNKFELGDNVFSNVDSLFDDERGTNMTGINVGSLLGSAANTLKSKHVNTGAVFGSLLGFPNFDIDNDKEVSLSSYLSISLDKNWVDPKIIKTQMEVLVRKLFVLDVNLLAVKGKSAMAKTQLIKKFFSTINALAKEKRIIINSDLKKQRIHSDQAIVIKKILMDTPKKMIIAAISEFGDIKLIKIQLIGMWQKAVIKSTKLEQTKQLASRWSFLIGKDLVHVAMAILLEKASGKTYVINYSLVTGNQPIFGGVRLSWTRMNLVCCKRYGHFGYSALECDSSDVLLARLYVKKCVPISCSTVFGGKFWAQIVLLKSVLDGSSFGSGSGSGFGSSPTGTYSLGGDPLLVLANNSALNDWLVSLKCFLELLVDQVSGIVQKLSGMKLVPLAPFFYPSVSAIPMTVNLDLGQNMVLNSSELISLFPSHVVSDVLALDPNSSKVLTAKVGSLDFGEVRSVVCWLEFSNVFFVPMNNLVWKISMCNVHGINVLAKQNNIIMNKFKRVQIFSFGLDKSFLGAREKLSVTILGLYADAFAKARYGQVSKINFFIVKADNSSAFVVMSKNFNENNTKRSANFKFCMDLGLIIDFIFVTHGLASAVAGHKVEPVFEFFDTNHKAVSIVVGLGGFLNVCLNSVHKQTNRNRWKFQIKNKILKKVVVVSADKVFSKLWFSESDVSVNKQSLKFVRFELLVAKLVKNISSNQVLRTACLINTWAAIDEEEAVKVRGLIESGVCSGVVLYHLSSVKKSYYKSKYYEFKTARDNSIKKAIDK